MQQTKTTQTTKKRHYKQTSSAVVQSTALTSLQLVFVGFFYMLQVCGHIKHVVVLVALHSCHQFICCQCSHIFTFHLYVNSLQIFVDSHTAKNGSSQVLSLQFVFSVCVLSVCFLLSFLFRVLVLSLCLCFCCVCSQQVSVFFIYVDLVFFFARFLFVWTSPHCLTLSLFANRFMRCKHRLLVAKRAEGHTKCTFYASHRIDRTVLQNHKLISVTTSDDGSEILI